MVKSILEEFGCSGKEVDTPGLPKGEKVELEEGQEPAAMDGPQASKFRRGVAKLNYLAQDRGDMAYASKGVSKHMAKPCLRDEKMLIRAIEYLRKHPRWVCMYEWQSPTKGFTIYTDSDWGGCTRTRRSTSGGGGLTWLTLHPHVVKNATVGSVKQRRGGAERISESSARGAVAKTLGGRVGEPSVFKIAR